MILDSFKSNFSTFVVFWVLFVLTWLLLRTKRPPGIPPGPIPIPFVGNVLHLRGDIRKVFRTLRVQYGDIFSLFVNKRLMVVVNGYEALKETFIDNADVFSNRPVALLDFLPEHLRKSSGIARASGHICRQNRRFALSTLRDFGMGKNKLQLYIQEETTILIRAIEKFQGKPFDMSHLLHNAVSNIICSLVFGKRFEYDDERYRHLLEHLKGVVTIGGITRRIFRCSWVKKIPGDITGMKRNIKHHEELFGFIKTSIEQHLKDFDEHHITSLIDAYIKQEKLHTRKLSTEELYGLELMRMILDLFLGGSETAATALRWSIVYYMNYPAIQNKAYTEVSGAVDPRRLPGIEDRQRLAYVEATISEVLRHANIGPFALTHAAGDDAKLRGYHIPKNSWLIVNLDSIMSDPALWTNPDQFDPDRFLEKKTLKKFEYFIPFGLGKRICPGESLARMELTIFLAALTRHFEFLPPEGEDPPPIEGTLGVTFAPKSYMVRAVRRTPETHCS